MLTGFIKFILLITMIQLVLIMLGIHRVNKREKREMSKLIVIDGIDGSGKATQTKKLVDSLREYFEMNKLDWKVVHLEFPNYESSSATLVKEYLNNEHVISDSYQSSLFYTVDRVATFTKKDDNGQSLLSQFNNGKCIFICDRYTTSNLLHQSSSRHGKDLEKYIQNMESIEYNLCDLPKPDLVLYLDVDPIVSMDNIMRRYNGDESKRDSHENMAHLTKVFNKRDRIIKKLRWNKITCSENGKMHSIDYIHKEISRVVYTKILKDNICKK